MLERRITVSSVLLLLLGTTSLSGQVIPNWSAPAIWTPERTTDARPLSIQSDIAGPLPFVPISPCRQYDSRSASPLPDNTSRTVVLVGPPCGIPAAPAADAISVNITVFNIVGATGNGVFRVGTISPPPTAWINFPPSETQRANAGIVANNLSGITVQVNMGGGQLDFTVDVNGYYSVVSSSNRTFDVSLDSLGPAIRGTNTSGACITGCGVAGLVTSTSGAYAVSGFAAGTSGANYGVAGSTNSPSAGGGGVLGLASGGAGVAPTAYQQAGIRGESPAGYGVLGVSKATGVGAGLVNNLGLQISYALLAASGPTNYAVFAGGDFGGTGAKYFVEPHPTDASQVIRYISLEGPEAGTYVRGRGRFEHGVATIQLPEDFRMVTDAEGLSIQVTPIGDFANVAVLQIDLDAIVVKASRNVEFFYLVNGARKTHKHLKPIGPGNEFVPQNADAKMPAHLTEGQKAMLVSNGTYNEDGTVNMGTAERLGWRKTWTERDAKADPAAETARKAPADRFR